jgi:hypothetical protein
MHILFILSERNPQQSSDDINTRGRQQTMKGDNITEYNIGKHSTWLSNFTLVSVCIRFQTAFSWSISYSEPIHET